MYFHVPISAWISFKISYPKFDFSDRNIQKSLPQSFYFEMKTLFSKLFFDQLKKKKSTNLFYQSTVV